MKLSNSQLEKLLALATEAALTAGRYIATFDRSQLKVDHKAAGNSLSSQVVTQVDLHSQTLILDVLQPSIEQYDLAVLSEENASEDNITEHARRQKHYFWCIDPLDGTLPFIEGSAGFAVSIALVSQSGDPVIGVVHNPATGDTYQALVSDDHPVLQKNGLPWHPVTKHRCVTLYIDRSFEGDPRYQTCVEQVDRLIKTKGYDGLKIVNSCGAVMNAIGVFENPPACYLKLPKAQKGGGSLWDFSATAAIAQSSPAFWASDINGQALDLNRSDSNFMNHKGVLYLHGIECEPFVSEGNLMRYSPDPCAPDNHRQS
ncbi:inositol-1-monophosphatase [Photobacterium proteolyticum]|uniref:Inositol-1-monophosphatase n=2 Tax=Photobacterium proteolyticum TaxID=1903952 RepID=A0A1Q9GEQ3_9GAMM|nr:inositol-1-monophosphatase [Photobacterium proteolyticum]